MEYHFGLGLNAEASLSLFFTDPMEAGAESATSKY
jgi:hypothetical protein